ncbi:MAG: hypothetical protein EOM19_04125 [Candidatus Moranbacteria bacterium]|nr:hypothetical protein [Candidatus Moranbacteria bacterium]
MEKRMFNKGRNFFYAFWLKSFFFSFFLLSSFFLSFSYSLANFTSLYEFDEAPFIPYGTPLLEEDFFYGMTFDGGREGLGAIFALEKNGSSFTILHEFFGGVSDGSKPKGSLIYSEGVFYGMTSEGGVNNAGTIFKIEKDGSDFTLLHSFSSASDGGNPQGSLVLEGDTLFGLASEGGVNNAGTIFKIQIDGTGFEVFHNFDPSVDGGAPLNSLILDDSILYGTTSNGGLTMGTIFKIQTDGTGFEVLHSFHCGTEGCFPQGALVFDNDILYGMTSVAGAYGGGRYF